MENTPQQPGKPVKLVVAQPLNAPQKPAQGKSSVPAGAGSNARQGNGSKADSEKVASVTPLPASALSESQKMRSLGNRTGTGAGRRGSKWTIPIALLCLIAAAGFVGFIIHIFNNQAQLEVANSRSDIVRTDESISKGAAKPGALTPSPSLSKPSENSGVVTQLHTGASGGPKANGATNSAPNATATNSKKSAAPADSPGPSVASGEPALSDAIKQLPPPKAGKMVASLPSGNLPAKPAKSLASKLKSKTKSSIAAPHAPPPVLPDPAGDEELVSLFKNRRLFTKTNYVAIRHIFVRRFENRFQQQIKQAYGSDYDTMNHWLDKNPEIKEELYLALDLTDNDVGGALAIFKQIKDKYPEKIIPLANLAIATSVAWGRSGEGIYDYLADVKATHSKSVGQRLDALGNFNYFVLGERGLGDRARALPWEFLVHMVNHYTPLDQRKWAAEHYFAERPMFGQCYKDVPWDSEFFNSKLKLSKLAGLEYTLENLHRHGGVSAEQADFASRVGKSIGVPAEAVHGDENFGQVHGWVIWVEIKNFSRATVGFSLESYGQFSYGKSYVGWLVDPLSAKKITDRDLELRLQAVGADQIGHRQAELVMRAFPMIRDKEKLSLADQLKFLDATIKLSPWFDEPWLEVARLAHDGQAGKDSAKQLQAFVDRMFITFAAFPDFTAKVFDNLTSFQTNARQRDKLNERLVLLFEQAGRPDLASDARLKLIDTLMQENRFKEAMAGLAVTIKRFPDDPPYTTKLLDQLDMVCKQSNLPHINESLAIFYRSYLPTIPQKHGERTNPFCLEMYQRGIELFKSAGNKELADQYSALLTKLKPPDKS